MRRALCALALLAFLAGAAGCEPEQQPTASAAQTLPPVVEPTAEPERNPVFEYMADFYARYDAIASAASAPQPEVLDIHLSIIAHVHAVGMPRLSAGMLPGSSTGAFSGSVVGAAVGSGECTVGEDGGAEFSFAYSDTGAVLTGSVRGGELEFTVVTDGVVSLTASVSMADDVCRSLCFEGESWSALELSAGGLAFYMGSSAGGEVLPFDDLVAIASVSAELRQGVLVRLT
ncbi:MAG: hypothetical protein Q4B99_06290 [Clostridia bacterium]|nr:hypothetical protein [Clostridia bacterium]